jgi:predicted site-specific integrase-resolvase
VQDQRLSPAKAADYIEREWHLRVSPATVRRWAKKGAVPSTTTAAGRVLIDPADLHAIFDAVDETQRCGSNER